MQNLEGVTAFITGGASGIGLGMAQAFLRAGMNIVADLRPDHIAQAKETLASYDNRVRFLEFDVTDRIAYAAAADEASARMKCGHRSRLN